MNNHGTTKCGKRIVEKEQSLVCLTRQHSEKKRGVTVTSGQKTGVTAANTFRAFYPSHVIRQTLSRFQVSGSKK
jgi:hypothetical protein